MLGGGGRGDIDIRWVQRRRWVGRDDFERALFLLLLSRQGTCLRALTVVQVELVNCLLFHGKWNADG